jgi:hypothetical protein
MQRPKRKVVSILLPSVKKEDPSTSLSTEMKVRPEIGRFRHQVLHKLPFQPSLEHLEPPELDTSLSAERMPDLEKPVQEDECEEIYRRQAREELAKEIKTCSVVIECPRRTYRDDLATVQEAMARGESDLDPIPIKFRSDFLSHVNEATLVTIYSILDQRKWARMNCVSKRFRYIQMRYSKLSWTLSVFVFPTDIPKDDLLYVGVEDYYKFLTRLVPKRGAEGKSKSQPLVRILKVDHRPTGPETHSKFPVYSLQNSEWSLFAEKTDPWEHYKGYIPGKDKWGAFDTGIIDMYLDRKPPVKIPGPARLERLFKELSVEEKDKGKHKSKPKPKQKQKQTPKSKTKRKQKPKPIIVNDLTEDGVENKKYRELRPRSKTIFVPFWSPTSPSHPTSPVDHASPTVAQLYPNHWDDDDDDDDISMEPDSPAYAPPVKRKPKPQEKTKRTAKQIKSKTRASTISSKAPEELTQEEEAAEILRLKKILQIRKERERMAEEVLKKRQKEKDLMTLWSIDEVMNGVEHLQEVDRHRIALIRLSWHCHRTLSTHRKKRMVQKAVIVHDHLRRMVMFKENIFGSFIPTKYIPASCRQGLNMRV